jgi:hypothetical protein
VKTAMAKGIRKPGGCHLILQAASRSLNNGYSLFLFSKLYWLGSFDLKYRKLNSKWHKGKKSLFDQHVKIQRKGNFR